MKMRSHLFQFSLISTTRDGGWYSNSYSDAVQNYIAKCRGTALPIGVPHITENCYRLRMNRKRESGNSYRLRETLKRQGGSFYRVDGSFYRLRETLKRQGGSFYRVDGSFYRLRETLKRQGGSFYRVDGSFYSLRQTYHGIWKTSLLVGREVKYSRLMHYLKPGIIVCFIVWVAIIGMMGTYQVKSQKCEEGARGTREK
jgi:hypothetical protein